MSTYLRASAFIMLGNSLPFILLCNLPFNSALIRRWPLEIKYTLIYVNIAMNSLIVEQPSRMPAYMGFIVSKAIGLMWRMIKLKANGDSK